MNTTLPPIQSTTFALTTVNRTLQLQTIEIGVRRDQLKPYSLGIQVFALEGLSLFYLNTPEAWRLVADSEIVVHPYYDMAVVPIADFKALEMIHGQRWNLFISMDDMILDFNSLPDSRNGRLAYQDENSQVFTGAGYEGEAFEGTLVSDYWPSFAGALFFSPSDCKPTRNKISTAIVYEFVLRGSLTTEIAAVFTRMSSTIRTIVEGDFMPNGLLYPFVNTTSLTIVDEIVTSPTNFTSSCPNSWEYCHAIETTLWFEHDESRALSQNHLRFLAYGFSTEITQSIRTFVEPDSLLYNGYEGIAADFNITLKSVGDTLDSHQLELVRNAIREFLNFEVESSGTEILEVQFLDRPTSMNGNGRLRRRMQESLNGVELSGRVHGSRSAYLPPVDFGLLLTSTFRNFNHSFIDLVNYKAASSSQLLPIQRNRFRDFSIAADFVTRKEILTNSNSGGADPESGGADSGIDFWVWILVAIGTTAAGLLFWYFYRRRQSAQKEKDTIAAGYYSDSDTKGNKLGRRNQPAEEAKPNKRGEISGSCSSPEDNSSLYYDNDNSESNRSLEQRSPREYREPARIGNIDHGYEETQADPTGGNDERQSPSDFGMEFSVPSDSSIQISEKEDPSAEQLTSFTAADSSTDICNEVDQPMIASEQGGDQDDEVFELHTSSESLQSQPDANEQDKQSSKTELSLEDLDGSSENLYGGMKGVPVPSHESAQGDQTTAPYFGNMDPHTDESIGDMSEVSANSFSDTATRMKNPYLSERGSRSETILDFTSFDMADTGSFGNAQLRTFRNDGSAHCLSSSSLVVSRHSSDSSLSPRSGRVSLASQSDLSDAASLPLVDITPPPRTPDQSKYSASFSNIIRDPFVSDKPKKSKKKRSSGKKKRW